MTEPMILTSKEHRTCHQRWVQFTRDFPDRVGLAKRVFDLAERSVLAFGPHVTDCCWIASNHIYREVYGEYAPLDTLLEVMHFPPSNGIVDRSRYVARVRELIREHELYGSDGNYMPRSVILGWICRQHDLLLGDINEAA